MARLRSKPEPARSNRRSNRLKTKDVNSIESMSQSEKLKKYFESTESTRSSVSSVIECRRGRRSPQKPSLRSNDVDVISSESSEDNQEKFTPAQQIGSKLKSIPIIWRAIQKSNNEDLNLLHRVCFDSTCRPEFLVNNLGLFEGFSRDSDIFFKKMYLEKVPLAQLKRLAKLLNLEADNQRKSMLVDSIVSFLRDCGRGQARRLTRDRRNQRRRAAGNDSDNNEVETISADDNETGSVYIIPSSESEEEDDEDEDESEDMSLPVDKRLENKILKEVNQSGISPKCLRTILNNVYHRYV